MSQFNSGTDSLLTLTRFLVNDPATAANNQYTDVEVKAAINVGYRGVVNDIKAGNPGYFFETSYATTVADQAEYANPTDHSRVVMVAVEYSGKDIESDTTANPTNLSRVSYKTLREAQLNSTSNVYLWARLHEHVYVYPTPTTGNVGSKALEIVQEKETASLSADTDEPLIPSDHHDLIVTKAAIYLLRSRDLSTRALREDEAIQTRQLVRTITSADLGAGQFQTSALPSFSYASKSGRMA